MADLEKVVEALLGISAGRKLVVEELEDKLKQAKEELEMADNAIFACYGKMAQSGGYDADKRVS